jgi:transcriptional regulator with XRE-family HTH domain
MLPKYSTKPFGAALTDLMSYRRISFRYLGYRAGLSAGYLNHLTKGSRRPNDTLMTNIARATDVDPEYFCEFRMNRLLEKLSDLPVLRDYLYSLFFEAEFVPRDFDEVLEGSYEQTAVY